MNQFETNKEIEQFVKAKLQKGEAFTDKDIAYMLGHEGSGGQGKHGAKGEGLLYQFFTPLFICELMWKLALHHGYDGGYVLEPSVATGRMLQHAPDKSRCVGFEIDPTLGQIAQLAFPEAKIYFKGCDHPYFKERTPYFETAFMAPDRFASRLPLKDLTWLNEYPFSLVIGNPPYGKHKNFYSGYFKNPKFAQIEMFFMYYGLLMLKPGGLMVYLTSSNFMRRGLAYQNEKQKLSHIATFVDAYRLPPVFASTQVPTDILIFKRK